MVHKYSVLVATCLICLLSGTAMAAPIIDGSLADWGLEKLKTDAWSVNETWIPNAQVTYIVEDNQNRLLGGSGFYGVHIKGTGSTYTYYHEQKVKTTDGIWTIEPSGGEPFDLEAVYMDQDLSTLYIGIVTSMEPAPLNSYGNPDGGKRPGDFALNSDSDLTTGENGYEYGIVVGENPYPAAAGLKQGDIVYLPDWESKGAIDPQERPDVIIGWHAGGGIVGNLGADFVYNNGWMTILDHGYPNYVIEAKIPKASIGSTGKWLKISDLFYADNCLNDTLYVPEFPTIAISIGAILGVAFLAINRRNRD